MFSHNAPLMSASCRGWRGKVKTPFGNVMISGNPRSAADELNEEFPIILPIIKNPDNPSILPIDEDFNILPILPIGEPTDEVGLPIDDEVGLPIEELPVEILPIEELPIDIMPIPIDELPIDLLPIDEIPGILPIEEIPGEIPGILPIDELPIDILPIDEEPDVNLPIEETPEVTENRRCGWGPAYYCQSKEKFDQCKGSTQSQDAFDGECKVIRDGMLNKCQDLGERFWCSSQSAFNYCVGSQGFTGGMNNFAACKPRRNGGRRNCARCGKCITKIYNIYSCACEHPVEDITTQMRR
jgi:hypothetical protein